MSDQTDSRASNPALGPSGGPGCIEGGSMSGVERMRTLKKLGGRVVGPRGRDFRPVFLVWTHKLKSWVVGP
jgi:hypothetical protein